MSLAVCLPAAVASAVAYGTASAVQHSAAHVGEQELDARGLGKLLRDPLWLAGVGADVAGLALQVLALATGPVSIVQPMQVLMLLVAFPVGAALGGPRVTRVRTAAAALVALGVATFLALAGDPGRGRAPRAGTVLVLTVAFLLVGGLLAAAAPRGRPSLRATVYGAVSGAWFAMSAVALRVLSLRLSHSGIRILGHARGIGPLVCLVVIGGAALAMTQAGFQIGSLADSLPAATATDPVVAVVLGVAVLGERLPLGAGHDLGYGLALLAVVVGARILTRPDPAAAAGDAQPVGQDAAGGP